MIRNSDDETNFPHKILLTDTQAPKIRKAFSNDSSVNRIFLKTLLSRMIRSRGFNILNLINPAEALHKIAYKAKDLSNKISLDKVIRIVYIFRKEMLDSENIFGRGITLTNNETKDIMKLIRSLQNKRHFINPLLPRSFLNF